MLIFSLFTFVGFTLMGMYFSGGVSLFVDIPSAILVFPATFVFTIAATSWQNFKLAFSLLLHGNDSENQREINNAKQVFNILGNLSVLIGVMSMFIGWIAIASQMSDPKALGPAIGVSLLSPFYGLTFKILCYFAEKKLMVRASQLNEV